MACIGNWGEVVRFLLVRGVDAESPDKTGRRCLHLSVERNRLEAIRELLNHRYSIEISGRVSPPPAAFRAHPSPVNRPAQKAISAKSSAASHPASRHVVVSGTEREIATKEQGPCVIKSVDALLAKPFRTQPRLTVKPPLYVPYRCDVEATLSDGLTRPLHIACRRGFEKAATLLLNHHADHAAVGTDGHTALHMAAKEGKAAIVEVRYFAWVVRAGRLPPLPWWGIRYVNRSCLVLTLLN